MISVASCSGSAIRKRRNDNGYDNSESPDIKVAREQYYVVLESESDVCTSEDDTESILSIQNKSTDFAKDTSDTATKSSLQWSDTEDNLAGVEYEVVSLSDHDDEHPPFDSYSSDTNSASWMTRHGEQSNEENGSDSICAEGDLSSGASDHNTLIPVSLRLRSCIKCKGLTNQFQYCRQCYKVRKDFFPPRPKRCKKKESKPFFKKKCARELPKLPLQENKSDSWVESGSSQELVLNDMLPKNSDDLCNVCLSKPKNGAFLHCRWVHIYSCYQCSLEIWFRNKRCPLCNVKVSRVLKVAMK